MSLPFVLDIATGLIFIYLILSLLASEIQELIATLLQWRAKHLKRSIEMLLAGGSEGSDDTEDINHARYLTSLLYNDPLINTLNYEEKGFIGSLARQTFKAFSSNFESLFNKANQLLNGNKSNVLDKNSAPSYIPNETFATTLLEALKIPHLVQELGKESLENFQKKQLDLIDSYLKPINDEQNINDDTKLTCQQDFQDLKQNFQEIYDDFYGRKVNLKISINRMIYHLDRYIETVQDVLPDCLTKRRVIRQLTLLRKDSFSDTTEAVWQGGLQPNLTLIINGYKEIKDGAADSNSPIHQKIQQLTLEGAKDTERLIDRLPKSLTNSLAVLANRAQIKADDAEEALNQFKQEIQTWFDRSMERSSGVYKRNSKGVAMLIGFLIAVVANADTLYIASRLSKDSVLRNAVTQNSAQASQDCLQSQPNNSPSTLNKLNCIRNTVDQTLTDISLPVGWTEYNINQQLGNQQLGVSSNSSNFILERAWSIIKFVSGLFLTSIAIAMGAPFWFDLLGRIVNVRNTGKKPTSPSESE